MRKPMITRTITTTTAVFLAVDTTTAEVHNIEVTLPRTFKDEAAMLKAAKPIAETDTVKLVSVVHSEVKEMRYGMEESKFVELATPLADDEGEPSESQPE